MNLNKITDAIMAKWKDNSFKGMNLLPKHFICEGSGEVVLSENDKQIAFDMGAKEENLPVLKLLISNRIKRGMK
jgi:hypothetical protein